MPPKAKDPSRPIVIAGASGGALDRFRGLTDLAKTPYIDIIVGDWMSEANMTVRGAEMAAMKAASKQKGINGKAVESNEDAAGPQVYLSRTSFAYDPYFLEQLEPALEHIAANGMRLACNAGGSNPAGLAKAVEELVAKKGLSLKVAYIEGDDVTDVVLDMINKGESFPGLPHDKEISKWGLDPVSAQCYLGGKGVAAAFEAGAEIVIAGRIADASALIGACMWWHDWNPDQHIQELAGALVAGHLTECSTYVTGGCYSLFTKFKGKDIDLTFPIAWIESNGEFELGMEEGHDGEISFETVASQLVYEIQGPLYFNSDVVADLQGIKVTDVSKNRVRITGVQGLPAPPTTKVGITARGGYRAEFHFYLTGLQLKEKAAMIERQTRAGIGKNIEKFDVLTFTTAGVAAEDPSNQNAATVDFRIFAQSKHPELMTLTKFSAWCRENILQSYPGGTPQTDIRQSIGKPYFEYWAALLPQSVLDHRVTLWNGEVISVAPPKSPQDYPRQQQSYDTSNPVSLDTWGPTERKPLGLVVLGRSGDKSSDANVGFFVRSDDEWVWLRSYLSLQQFKHLLADEYIGKPIDRFEIAGINAVHFLLRDHLDRGYNSSSGYDSLGKNLVEYIRAKHVDIPTKFLSRYPPL